MPPDRDEGGRRRPRLVIVRIKFKVPIVSGRRWPVLRLERIEIQDASVEDVTESPELGTPTSTVGEDGTIESSYYEEYAEDENPRTDPVVIKGDRSTPPAFLPYQWVALGAWVMAVMAVLACLVISVAREGDYAKFLAVLLVLFGGGYVIRWVFRR